MKPVDGKKTFVYAPEVETEWVDEDGKPLKTPVVGQVTEKAGTVDSYEFVKTVTDKNGNVKHIFRKIVKPVPTSKPTPKPAKPAAKSLAKTGSSGLLLAYASLLSVLGAVAVRRTRKYRN